jgi:hypothetical protein
MCSILCLPFSKYVAVGSWHFGAPPRAPVSRAGQLDLAHGTHGAKRLKSVNDEETIQLSIYAWNGYFSGIIEVYEAASLRSPSCRGLAGSPTALLPRLPILLRSTSRFEEAPIRSAFSCNCESSCPSRPMSLSSVPTNSSLRTLPKTDAKSCASRFPFPVGRMIKCLRSRPLRCRVIRPAASRRSTKRVTIALSLPRTTDSFPGLLCRASTQRSNTLACWTVIPNFWKRRLNDVCNRMQV